MSGRDDGFSNLPQPGWGTDDKGGPLTPYSGGGGGGGGAPVSEDAALGAGTRTLGRIVWVVSLAVAMMVVGWLVFDGARTRAQAKTEIEAAQDKQHLAEQGFEAMKKWYDDDQAFVAKLRSENAALRAVVTDPIVSKNAILLQSSLKQVPETKAGEVGSPQQAYIAGLQADNAEMRAKKAPTPPRVAPSQPSLDPRLRSKE